jgi:hypothetical protein
MTINPCSQSKLPLRNRNVGRYLAKKVSSIQTEVIWNNIIMGAMNLFMNN